MQSHSNHPGGAWFTRYGIRIYLFVCLGMVAALPALWLGISQVKRWSDVQVEQADREGLLVAEILSHEIVDIVDSSVETVETVAKLIETRGSMDPPVLQRLITPVLEKNEDFKIVFVANPVGTSVAFAPPLNEEGKPNVGMNYADRDYYKEMRRTGNTAISQVVLGKATRRPEVIIASPILDAAGKMLGFAGASIELDSIQKLADQTLKGMPGVKIVVLDQEGRALVHPEEAVRRKMQRLSLLPLFQPPKRREGEVRIAADEKGEEMRAAAFAIPSRGLNWTILVYRPEATVQQESAAARRQTIMTAAFALLVGLLLSLALAQIMAHPIRVLASTAALVGKGDYSRDLPSPRPWQPYEVRTLQSAVNGMVMQLRAHTEELEKRVAQRTAQLTEANREMESFVYSISHDLKTPVVSVHGMASMFLNGYENMLDEKGRHYIQRILSNARFMEQLIADLLAFSRLGKQESMPQKLDSEGIVRDVLEQCQGAIKDRSVDVRIHSPLPSIYFDSTQFKKIFLNLINNGIKFMGDQRHPRIEIGAAEAGDRVEFYVMDNGIGVDPKHHELIFGIFQRLKEVDVDGSGIGLATVKKIIDLAGEKIRVESAKGFGATFFFTAPKG